MKEEKKEGRYRRILVQLEELFSKSGDPLARMATICALLHHKMDHFFWTGFYLHKNGRLVVGPYQGPLACQELPDNQGVCWAAIISGEPVLVPDVHDYPGHVACDPRSRSEITVPVFDRGGDRKAVLDVDSDRPDAFSSVDRTYLEKIVAMIYG